MTDAWLPVSGTIQVETEDGTVLAVLQTGADGAFDLGSLAVGASRVYLNFVRSETYHRPPTMVEISSQSGLP